MGRKGDCSQDTWHLGSSGPSSASSCSTSSSDDDTHSSSPDRGDDDKHPDKTTVIVDKVKVVVDTVLENVLLEGSGYFVGQVRVVHVFDSSPAWCGFHVLSSDTATLRTSEYGVRFVMCSLSVPCLFVPGYTGLWVRWSGTDLFDCEGVLDEAVGRESRSIPWGPFLIAPVVKKGVQVGWGGTCKGHSNFPGSRKINI